MSVRPEVFEEVLTKQCKCSEPAVLRVTKSGPNEGREFWTCENRMCDFFQWNSKSVARARKQERMAKMAVETPQKKEEEQEEEIDEEPPRKMCKIVIDDETTLTIPRDRLTKLLFD